MKIFVITHGLLAKGLVDSTNLIVGEQDNIDYFSLEYGENIDDFKSKLEENVTNSKDDILCFTDIVNGSPFNIVSELTLKYPNVYHICGVNLPMILDAVLSNMPLNEESVKGIIESGTSSVFDARLFLKEKLGEEY